MKKLLIATFCLIICWEVNGFAFERYPGILLRDKHVWMKGVYKKILDRENQVENHVFVGREGYAWWGGYGNYFNSLSDFLLVYHVGGDSSGYRVTFQPSFMIDSVIGIGVGTYLEEGKEEGQFFIGNETKSIKPVEHMHLITYEGYILSDPGTLITAQLDPKTGTIYGAFGEFYFESSAQSLGGVLKAPIYSLKKGNEAVEGMVMLHLYGDEADVLAGGYVADEYSDYYYDGRQGGLIYLRRTQ